MESSPATSLEATTKRRSFISRLVSTVGLWAVVLLAIWWQSQCLFLGIACVVGMLGVLEYFHLAGHEKPDRAYALLGMSIGVGWWAATLVWTGLSAATARMPPPLGWNDLAALVIAIQGAFLLAYRGGGLEGTVTLHRIFSTVFGVFYTIVCFGFLVRLLFFTCPAAGLGASPAHGISLVLYLIATTKFADMGAYVIGSIFGRHKMIPHISPAKSWEGLAGALLGTSVATALMWLIMPHYLLAPLTITHSVILIPIICFTAVTGDLAESIIKRCVFIKDSGHKLPGIGGILDLTDSLLFTAPVFYLYLTLL